MGANLWLAWQESQTIDEAAHITAGYSYITTQDFRLNPEHPPLLKELSALPLLALNVKDVKNLNGWDVGDEWTASKEFVYSSNSSPRQIMFVARLMPIIIALALGLLVFALASYFTNRSFGLLALGLYCFDPNIIAHSHLVTTDVASALGFLVTLASLFYYVNRPSLKRLIIVGLSLGLALSLKFSTILLLPFIIFILASSVFYFNKTKITLSKKLYSLIKKYLLVFLIALTFLFIVYGFEIVKPSSTAGMVGNLANETTLFDNMQNINIPFYSFLRGLEHVLARSQLEEPVYLLGNFATSTWYYFFVAILVKTPLATILGVILSVAVGLKYLYRAAKTKLAPTKKSFYAGVLVLFIVVYLASSMFTTINIGWRHILPIYPMLFIIIAIAFKKIKDSGQSSNLKMLSLSSAFLIGLVFSLAAHWPYVLSYSNELIPIVNSRTNWPRLVDSNLDWGQDQYRLINYVKQHPNDQFRYHIFTNADLTKLNAPANLDATDDEYFDKQQCHLTGGQTLLTSWQIVYNDVTGSTFSCLRGRAPSGTIGFSILIFSY